MTDPLTPPLTEAEIEALGWYASDYENYADTEEQSLVAAVRRIREAERERVIDAVLMLTRDVLTTRSELIDRIAALRGTEGA